MRKRNDFPVRWEFQRAAWMIPLSIGPRWTFTPTARRHGIQCYPTRQSFRGGAPPSTSGMTAARKPPMTPDLVSQGSAREPYSRSENQPSSSLAVAKAVNNLSMPRHVLPSDLSKAVRQLDDRELDRLLSAVLDDQRRRRRDIPVPDISLGKRRTEVASIQLTRGQINAVRAAFKAGVSPSRIARQFGLSQSDVRKVLAQSDSPHRV